MRNDFASLDAQTAEGALATVAAHELPAEGAPCVCSIETDDLGDDDCRKLVFRVIVAGAVLFTGRTRGEAVGYAKTNHYTVTN